MGVGLCFCQLGVRAQMYMLYVCATEGQGMGGEGVFGPQVCPHGDPCCGGGGHWAWRKCCLLVCLDGQPSL